MQPCNQCSVKIDTADLAQPRNHSIVTRPLSLKDMSRSLRGFYSTKGTLSHQTDSNQLSNCTTLLGQNVQQGRIRQQDFQKMGSYSWHKSKSTSWDEVCHRWIVWWPSGYSSGLQTQRSPAGSSPTIAHLGVYSVWPKEVSRCILKVFSPHIFPRGCKAFVPGDLV